MSVAVPAPESRNGACRWEQQSELAAGEHSTCSHLIYGHDDGRAIVGPRKIRFSSVLAAMVRDGHVHPFTRWRTSPGLSQPRRPRSWAARDRLRRRLLKRRWAGPRVDGEGGRRRQAGAGITAASADLGEEEMSMERRIPEPLWTPTDVAAYLNVPMQTLYQWRRSARGRRAGGSDGTCGTSRARCGRGSPRSGTTGWPEPGCSPWSSTAHGRLLDSGKRCDPDSIHDRRVVVVSAEGDRGFEVVARPPVVKFAEPTNALARPSAPTCPGKKRTETFGNVRELAHRCRRVTEDVQHLLATHRSQRRPISARVRRNAQANLASKLDAFDQRSL